MKAFRQLALLSLVLGAAGCVSSNAGFGRTRAILRDRAGLDARWVAVEGGDVAAAKAKILAKPLTADGAAKLAIVANPRVQASFERLGIARASLVRALRLPNPELDADIHFFPDQTKVDLDVTLDVTELIFIPFREQAASASLDAASAEVAGLALDVALEAKIAFFDHEAAVQKLELQKKATFAMGQSADLAARMNQAGNVTDLVMLRQQALYEEARLALAKAELDAVTARERLASAMGLWGADAAKLTTAGSLAEAPEEPPALADVTARALDKSLDLEALRLRYGEAGKRADLARAEGIIPHVAVGAGAEREDDEWGPGPHVRLSLPLFYQGEGEADEAEAMRRGSKAELEGTAIRLRAVARTLVSKVGATRERAVFYKQKLVPLRDKILEETLRQYNAMAASAFDVLQAKRDQLDTQRAHVDALRDYWIARAELDVLLAGHLPKSVSALATTDMPVQDPGGEGH